jgi:hypothetical protein
MRIVTFVIVQVADQNVALAIVLDTRREQVARVQFEIRTAAQDNKMKREFVMDIQLFHSTTGRATWMGIGWVWRMLSE